MIMKAINTSPVKNIVYDICKIDAFTKLTLRLRLNYEKDGKLVSMYNLGINDDGSSTLYISPNYTFELSKKSEDGKQKFSVWMDEDKYHEFFNIIIQFYRITNNEEKSNEVFGRLPNNRLAIRKKYADRRWYMNGFKIGKSLEMTYAVKYYDAVNYSYGINLYINEDTVPIFISNIILAKMFFAYNHFNYMQMVYDGLNLISAQMNMKQTEAPKNPNMVRKDKVSIFN